MLALVDISYWHAVIDIMVFVISSLGECVLSLLRF